jgi:hypothetical protein
LVVQRIAIDGTTVICRVPEPVFMKIDDDRVGLDVNRGLAHSLNPTAARVWELIEHPRTLDEVSAELVGEYRVDLDTCRTQVSRLVEALHVNGLVQLTRS